jgi:ribosomal-protein-alanine N-acetyltransferase
VPDEGHSAGADSTIRRLQPEDVRTVWTVFQSAPEAAEWSEASIRTSLLDKQTTALVSVLGEEISGCIFGINVAREAEILNLAVKLGRRRMGFGRALVLELLSEWKKESVQRVFLEVRESNAGAIKLYEGLNFRLVGRRKKYYSLPEEDALVLERPGP